MALNSSAPLSALAALCDAIAAVQTVYIGMPKAPTGRLVAVVTLAGQEIRDKAAGGLVERDGRYRVFFGYALKGASETDVAAVQTAELAMAAAVDAFLVAIYAARVAWAADATLGNIKSIDPSSADDPRYATWPGDEFRLYPITITVAQRVTT